MFTNESAMDQLATVSRMLAYQQERGQLLPSAVERLRTLLPNHYDNTLTLIEAMLRGDKSVVLTGAEPGPFKMFTHLAQIIRDEDGDVSRLFIGTRECLRDAVVQVREYWSGFNALISYIVVVFVIAILVMGVFSVKVLPQFAKTYNDIRHELPAFTQLVLQGDIIFVFAIGLFALIVGGSLACSYHIKKRVAQFLPLSPTYKSIPGLKRLNEVYSYYLFIQYANALTSSGISNAVAINRAAELAQLPVEKTDTIFAWWEAIKLAGELNALSDEIYYQTQQVGSLFNRQMIETREVLTLGTQLFLGALIGALVIAMYLPIFMLGSAI